MSRHILHIFVVGWGMLYLALFPQVALSDHFGESAALKFFNGGSLDGLFSLRSSLLSGPGINGALYGMTAPNETGPFNIFGNPAVLGRIQGDQISYTMTPQLEFDVEALTELDANLEEQISAGFASFRQVTDLHDVKPTPATDGSGRLRRDGTGLGGIAGSFSLADSETKWFSRFPKLFDRIAVGYHQPFYMNITADWSGLRMRIRTINNSHDEAEELIMYTSIKMTTELLMTADSWALAAARQMGNFWLGVGLSRTDIGINISGHQKTEGILSRRADEKAFNDPDDPWDNAYFNSAKVQIDGTSVGVRLGVTHQPSPKFFWGADIQLQSKAKMEGPMEFEVHTFQALNLNADADAGEESFDINKIDITELTRTHSKKFEPFPLTVELPGYFSIGFAYLGILSPNLTFKKYFGELSYSLKMLEDGAEFNYKRGFKPDWNALLGFKLGNIKIGIGAIKLTDMNEGYHDKNGDTIKTLDPIVIPRLSMGFDSQVAENVTLGLLGFGMPEDSYRLSLKFEF